MDYLSSRRGRAYRIGVLVAGILTLIPPLFAAETHVMDPPRAISAETSKKILKVVKIDDAANMGANHDNDLELQMLRDFAASIDRKIEWVNVFRSEEAFQRLVTGAGDISISTLPVDRWSDPRVYASEPISKQRYRVFGRQDLTINGPLDLAGASVAVKLSSPLWTYLDRLRDVVPNLRLQVLPNDLTRDETLQMVSDGTYDAALIATDVGKKPIADFPRLKFLFDLSPAEGISWFAGHDNSALITSLNNFIKRFHPAYYDPDASLRTFGDIKYRRVLRVITRLDGGNYFLKRGRPTGFELDLARRFAERYGLRLEVLVARNDREILRWLRKGAGDIVTTRINASAVHGEPAFAMSREYRHEASVLVSASRTPIRSTVDLRNKTIAAYAGTSNFEALHEFASGVSSVISVTPEVPLALLLERIENGAIDAAIIDASDVNTVLDTHAGLVAGMSIPNSYRYRWTLRGADAALALAVDDFLKVEYQGKTYNLLERRYAKTKQPKNTDYGDISPFDTLLQTYAAKYDFDWRLIAAQMYQESQFDPNAVSTAGAIGLMQLMPATANDIGVKNPYDPEAGIHGGIKYLNHLRDRFDADIPVSERTWLALAAYNIGYDRVRRARILAAELGLNPDKWFDNVEYAMRRMTQLHLTSRGGCRCGQAIVYVRSIQSLYHTYRNLEVAAQSPWREIRPTTPRRPISVKARTG